MANLGGKCNKYARVCYSKCCVNITYRVLLWQSRDRVDDVYLCVREETRVKKILFMLQIGFTLIRLLLV